MPGFHPPSISEFQPLIVRSRTRYLFALSGRAGQQWSRALEPLVGRDDFWARHDAGPALGASETGRFTLVHRCLRFLKGSARKQIEPPVAAPSRGVNLGREGSGFVHRIFSRLPYGDARQWPYAHWCF
jgi:hypothetical protein